MPLLPSIEKLTHDVFQSLYGHKLCPTEEDRLTKTAKIFNRHLFKRLLDLEAFPTIREVCFGRSLPAYEATEAFISHICANMEELLGSANGAKHSLDVLEKEAQKQTERLGKLRQKIDQINRPNPPDSQKLLRLADRAHSKVQQLETIRWLVEGNLHRERTKIGAILAEAIGAAQARAVEAQAVLRSWGNEAGDLQSIDLNLDILQKVRASKMLLDISKYLGRMKELLQRRRQSIFAFGRGEKYSVETGNSLQHVLTSEFGLLASSATVPLFLRKFQCKALKQYQRRERVTKGLGDRVVCLDNSSSTCGEPAAWGRAVAFALLDITNSQRRNLALIHFSSAGRFETHLFPWGRYSFEDMAAAAKTFLDGGTDYVTPLRESVRLIEQEGYRNANLVFITEGLSKLPENFQRELAGKKRTLGFTITGILMGGVEAERLSV